MSQSLTESQMIENMSEIMSGQWDDSKIEYFLLELSERGETVEEITGAAKVMREKALHINAPENAVDCCGTGGDASGTYNISTAVAIVSAACGIPVAKHGNRSASSKSGAADVLEAMGINLDVPQEKLEEALKRFNFAFLMAPNHHSAMRFVGPVRKKIGKRTIFNILGPLANPAKTQKQLLGVFDENLVDPIAHVLKNLGTTSAWVVHGHDGLDEITTTTSTTIAKLHKGEIAHEIISPENFGINTASPDDLKGGEPQENAEALMNLLKGAKNPYRDIVIANSAAVLSISGQAETLTKAVSSASEVLDNGKAFSLFEHYRDFTNE